MDNGLLQRGDTYFRPEQGVLILIVMDNGLLRRNGCRPNVEDEVLILIVMDNGLLPPSKWRRVTLIKGLNPYCNG